MELERLLRTRSDDPLHELETGAAAPAQREASVILGEWREAERRLSAAPPGTPEHEETRAAVDRLRSEYRAAYSAVSAQPDEDP
jgi:hypothetical protein